MFSVEALEGIPEIVAGDDLATIIGDAIERSSSGLQPGDILAITSKIVSKAEGRTVRAPAREDAITAETVRVVATRTHPGGLTRIVENRLGLVLAAAGVDSSNTPYGTVLLLPRDPDASAVLLAQALRDRFDAAVGVVITDTLGRPWRVGQTDAAIGAAGIRVLDDLRGGHDANGRPLEVTVRAVGDEIAAAADLVKGKADNLPVALIRGLRQFVVGLDAPGARSIIRDAEHDMFRQGSAEARAEGFAAGLDAGLARDATHTPAADAR
ncbi:MAG: coenzyme F420-0:L-glutamate ligase [Terrimesophilobacter sp.]